MMGKLYVTLCEVEEAFLNGKIDEVAKIVESLKEHEKSRPRQVHGRRGGVSGF